MEKISYLNYRHKMKKVAIEIIEIDDKFLTIFCLLIQRDRRLPSDFTLLTTHCRYFLPTHFTDIRHKHLI